MSINKNEHVVDKKNQTHAGYVGKTSFVDDRVVPRVSHCLKYFYVVYLNVALWFLFALYCLFVFMVH